MAGFPQLQTVSLDSLVSSTLQNMGLGATDNIIKSVPLVRALMDENARHSAGGTRIYAPLIYGFNTTTTFYNMSDYLDASPQEAITAAQYKWCNLTGLVTIFGEEEAANSGDARIEDFAYQKVRQLEMSFARQLNISAYGDGTGFFGAAPDGLANIIFQTASPADPPSGAVGGISAVTYPFWRNNANLAPGAYAANGAMGTSSPDYQLRMYHICSDGSLRTSLIVSDNGVYESYQINAGVHYRTLEQSKVDLGFEHVMYKGVPWYWDRDCPTATQYFINTEFLFTYVDPNRFFTPTPWMPTISQDGKVMRVHLRMNNVCTNRMLQGVIQGWT